jgi:TolB-like protein/DNA-binding winged helix-turn-helix (wHTH) protein/Flp pilus assembly protein TadD
MAVIRFGAFEVDLRAGELRKHGMRIGLQQQPFRILALLLEHPGEVVTREELRQAIWPTTAFGSFDEGLDAAIYKLRSALDDSAEHPRFVETLPRRGYRFIGVLEGAVEPSAPAQTEQPASVSKRTSLVWVGGLTILAALVLLMAAGDRPARLLGRGATSRIQSLAVLPLRNLSGDSAQEYFAEGMTEALTTRLGNTAGLRVISHTSAMHYKGTRATLPEIGRELKVDAVVEGAVLRARDRVRVTVQLVQTSTDRHLWAETYERDLQDVLGLQDAIAVAIAHEVQSRVSSSPPSPVPSTRTRPVDPEAYDLYLQGRARWNEQNLQGFRESIEYFEQAIQLDSSYAPAWAGLADAYAGLGAYNFLAPKVAFANAKAAALRAVQLDETLSEAHVPLAIVLLHLDWSWSAAEQEFRRAIALNPNNAFAHEAYGHLLTVRGQFGAALGEKQRALAIDPLSPNSQYAIGATLYKAGRYDEALRYLRLVPDGDAASVSRHRTMAAIYEREGKWEAAVAEWSTALRIGGKQEVAASVEHAYRATGYATAKRTYLLGEVAEAERRALAPYPRAQLWDVAADYALLGDKDRAFEWLTRSFREGEWEVTSLAVDDRLEGLRADPRFRELARRIGLPDTSTQGSIPPGTR